MTAGGKGLAEAKIQKGILKGDSLSPLIFIIAMMPLNQILRKCTVWCKVTKSQEKINHLMYMDDTKLWAKNEVEWKTSIHSIRIFIGMESGIEKCAMLVMKSGIWLLTDGMKLPKQDKIRTLGEKENTWGYWKLTPSNKRRWKKKFKKKTFLKNQKATRDKTI